VGATGLNIAANDLTTATNAQTTLTALDSAIDTVALRMADIGSAQNRIDFARVNTETTIENFANAESVVRDVDIAAETTEFARLSIQQQAATAMLAQANAAPQLLLSLLQ
jgi:flagellin